MQLLLQRAMFLMPQMLYGRYILGICQIKLYHGLPKISPCQSNRNSFQDPPSVKSWFLPADVPRWIWGMDDWMSAITSLQQSFNAAPFRFIRIPRCKQCIRHHFMMLMSKFFKRSSGPQMVATPDCDPGFNGKTMTNQKKHIYIAHIYIYIFLINVQSINLGSATYSNNFKLS